VSDYDKCSTSQRAERLTPWTRRQNPDGTSPLLSRNKRDVHAARCCAVLKRIVEHRDGSSKLGGALDAICAPSLDHYRDAGVQSGVDKRLVASIASQHNCWSRSKLREPERKPGGEGSLAGTAN
jgi:hypothetical protein